MKKYSKLHTPDIDNIDKKDLNMMFDDISQIPNSLHHKNNDSLNEELFHDYVVNVKPINKKSIVSKSAQHTTDIIKDNVKNKKTKPITTNVKNITPNKEELLPKKQNQFDNISFVSAIQDVTPLPGKGRMVIPHTVAISNNLLHEKKSIHKNQNKTYSFIVTKYSDTILGYILGFDIQTIKQLQTGKIRPQTKLDLHGLTAQQAFQAIINFFHTAYMNEHKIVLIIPGRGKNSPQGVSILKEKIQEWFVQEPLQRVILAFCTAHIQDGGSGAFYVLLRKYKKSHIIHWSKRSLDPDTL